MPDLHNIPARDHPCWDDANWRRDTLIRVCGTHEIDEPELARLTGSTANTVRFWLTKHRTAIGAATLRALLYDLNARRLPALRGQR